MSLNVVPFSVQVVALWAVAAYLCYRLFKLRPEPPPRIRLNFHHPMPRRANMMVVFDGGRDVGPFSTRATLVSGRGLALTRDAVDGLPDGEDPHRLTAPMTLIPLGDGVHRTVGPIGIDSAKAAKGRIKVEVLDGAGRPVAVTTSDF